MNDEGYIKFDCNWIKSGPLPAANITEVNKWRAKLYKLGLIGAYKNGIGFGNISIRLHGSKFIISGSKTGNIAKLSNRHYTIVSETNIDKNKLTCKGPVMASSESLTHAALYIADKDVNSVIHVHNWNLWKKLMNNVPTTREVPYGTPQMAKEIYRLFSETDIQEKKILVMAGHEGGIISFGKNIEEAGKILLQYVKNTPKIPITPSMPKQ